MEDSQTEDSFQHELEDYIRQQRARGLQPKICFRKETGVSVPQEGYISFRSPVLEQQLSLSRNFPSFPTSYERLSAEERQVPLWSKIHHSRQRLESPSNCQNNHYYFSKSPWLPSHSLSWEDGSMVHPAGYQDRCQRRQWEEEGDAATEDPVKGKRKYRAEIGSLKEHQGLDRKRTKTESERIQNSSSRMKSHLYGADAPKVESQPHRKKKGHSKESLEERDLWDEAILGSCY
ncbi:lysine-rich coiled-coil protein 1-like [Dipodomys merriami]|uniref:lysine-rich coiled-coil protein 1-like n=1 Tax=Dipodomys merriami TaxID=94247 RepID=UPI0038560DAF